MVIGVIMVVLNQAATVYTSKDLPQPRVPIDVSQLTEIGQAPNDNTPYHLWRAVEGNPQSVPPGDYLVNDQGQIRYLVDPGINGRIDRQPDGTPVVKYRAPKAQLMAFVTKGMLNRNLPWELVLLGVAIAIVLELCRVPSLPFAVGVYLPLSSSAPIFIGGLVRWVVDAWSRRGKHGQEISETDSDMSPGVLLSTGYIAGGAIVGVLIAFLSFSDTIPKLLTVWQFRTTEVAQAVPLNQQFRDIAWNDERSDKTPPSPSQLQNLAALEGVMKQELQRIGTNLNSAEDVAYQMDRLAMDEARLAQVAGVKSGESESKAELLELASIIATAYEIQALNEDQLPKHVAVSRGMNLNIPGSKQHEVKDEN
jgi:hypothetical protein